MNKMIDKSAKGFMIAMQIKDEKSMSDKPEKVG